MYNFKREFILVGIWIPGTPAT